MIRLLVTVTSVGELMSHKKVQELEKIIRELQNELLWYERAYRSLLDQVNSLQPSVRILQLQRALDEEVAKRKALSKKVTAVMHR